jgi:hypothetical protein
LGPNRLILVAASAPESPDVALFNRVMTSAVDMRAASTSATSANEGGELCAALIATGTFNAPAGLS